MSGTDCLFCSIVAGSIPADIVLDHDEVMAFRDIGPQAPSHVLVIPKQHISSLASTADADEQLLGRLMLAARDVARLEGLEDSGFRTVLNTGGDGGQTVEHLHVHVLGGRALSWPPGGFGAALRSGSQVPGRPLHFVDHRRIRR